MARDPALLHARYPKLLIPERWYGVLCQLLANEPVDIDWSSLTAENWQELEAVALGEQCSPMLAWLWQKNPPVGVPKEVLRRLAIALMRIEAYQESRFRELNGKLLPALREQGVQVILLKGAALAVNFYPHNALRPMGDFDLLVHPENLEKATQAAMALGYERPRPALGPTQEKLLDEHHVVLVDHRSEIAIEIHPGLPMQPLRGELEWQTWFWQSAVPVYAEQPALDHIFRLGATAFLLHLAHHLALQHGEAQTSLIKYYDLHLVICQQYDEIDWYLLAERAVQGGFALALLTALRACADRFHTPIPEGYLSLLEHNQRDETQVAEELWHKSQAIGQNQDRAIRFEIRNVLRKSDWRTNLLFIVEMLFPRRASMIDRYHPRPTWIWWVYYIKRGWRGLGLLALFVRMRFQKRDP